MQELLLPHDSRQKYWKQMERVQELIDKLWKQQQQQEAPDRLLVTVQSLQDALLVMIRRDAAASAGKVAVVLPPKRRITTVEVAAPPPKVQQPVKPEPKEEFNEPVKPSATDRTFDDMQTPAAKEQPPVPTAAEEPANNPSPRIPDNPPVPAQTPLLKNPYSLQKPAVADTMPPAVASSGPIAVPQPEEREVYHLHFDTPDEAPTLTQQHYNPATRELHEVIGEAKESLNDRLKQDKPELAHKLKEVPIKDLRKAIGVNDKFLFVRELFRGDEAMYERSIKTINAFHILAEAEYWISRELKVKLGWDDSRDAVQTFYQLVKRRFS